MSRSSNHLVRVAQAALGTAALGAALVAGPGLASAAAATPAPAGSTAAAAPASQADVPGCLPLTAGAFSHTFDPVALTLTVDFVPTDPVADGLVLCGGGQAFTVATWATQATGYALPQRLLGAAEGTVTVAGTEGRVVVTAPPATGCAAQVDAYMAPASAVPAVLTGFNTGEPRDGGPDAAAVNEPPLVGTPQAPHPSNGTVADQQPYTLVDGTVCTLPATLTTTTSCTDGTTTASLLVHNPNPWTVRYEVLLDGVVVDAPELADPGVAGGATGSVSGALDAGTYEVRVIDENEVAASTTVVVAACDTATTTAPPTTTGADPSVGASSTQRTPTTSGAAPTDPQVSGVLLARTTGGTGTAALASTGASVALPLGLGAAALALGTGFVAIGRATRGRHSR